jgi:hypothetical protein
MSVKVFSSGDDLETISSSKDPAISKGESKSHYKRQDMGSSFRFVGVVFGVHQI